MSSDEEAVEERIEISKADVKAVIGRKEEQLKSIREKSNCRIEISYKTTPNGICKITGTRKNVIIALRVIREVCEMKIENHDILPNLRMPLKSVDEAQAHIPPALPRHRSVKPEDGGMIKMLQAQLGNKLLLPYTSQCYDPCLPSLPPPIPLKPKFIATNQIYKNPFNDESCESNSSFQKLATTPMDIGSTQTDEHLFNDQNNFEKIFIPDSEIILPETGPSTIDIVEDRVTDVVSKETCVIQPSHPQLVNKNIQTDTDSNKKQNSLRLRFQKVKAIFGRNKSKSVKDGAAAVVDVIENKNEYIKIADKKIPCVPNNQSVFECGICFEVFKIDDGCIKCEKNPFVEITSNLTHSICIDCMRGYAHSAITDIQVANGGLGLKCIDAECTNVFLLTSFEFYLSDDDFLPLKLRLQEQCLADASLEDLVTCSDCGLRVCAPPFSTFYICERGRRQCRFCPRLYDAVHEDKTCEEMNEEENINISSQKMESKISEAIIRKCHKCNIAFVKNEGCNKMTCQCGAKQCYVCHHIDIDYSHFCSCDTQKQHGKCEICKKGCRLWENVEELDQIKINELQQLFI
uniref:RING-type domain-containing protein n=1 Tax=Panagrolaimus sp. PS1159 TaxID=55785 RepID=A0AC35F661_9BILA